MWFVKTCIKFRFICREKKLSGKPTNLQKFAINVPCWRLFFQWGLGEKYSLMWCFSLGLLEGCNGRLETSRNSPQMWPVGDYSLSEALGKNRLSSVSDYGCLEAAMEAYKLAEILHKCALLGNILSVSLCKKVQPYVMFQVGVAWKLQWMPRN